MEKTLSPEEERALVQMTANMSRETIIEVLRLHPLHGTLLNGLSDNESISEELGAVRKECQHHSVVNTLLDAKNILLRSKASEERLWLVCHGGIDRTIGPYFNIHHEKYSITTQDFANFIRDAMRLYAGVLRIYFGHCTARAFKDILEGILRADYQDRLILESAGANFNYSKNIKEDVLSTSLELRFRGQTVSTSVLFANPGNNKKELMETYVPWYLGTLEVFRGLKAHKMVYLNEIIYGGLEGRIFPCMLGGHLVVVAMNRNQIHIIYGDTGTQQITTDEAKKTHTPVFLRKIFPTIKEEFLKKSYEHHVYEERTKKFLDSQNNHKKSSKVRISDYETFQKQFVFHFAVAVTKSPTKDATKSLANEKANFTISVINITPVTKTE